MTRSEYYQDWDGICVRDGADYFSLAPSGGMGSTCLSCSAQYSSEQKEGLKFDEDRGDAEHYRKLLDRFTAVNLGIAAAAIYAARYGSYDADDYDYNKLREIQYHLWTGYGNSLTVEQVRVEMEA